MGTPVKVRPPPPPGVDCPSCCPTPWPSGSVPSLIRCVLHGMTDFPGHPPQPNGIPVHLVQDAENPCYWEASLYFGPAEYTFWYIASAAQLGVDREDPQPRAIFESYLDPCSIGPFLNVAIQPDYSQVGGTGYLLDFPLSIVLLVADTYNFQPDELALYDLIDSQIEDHKCLRLTGRISPGSCLFLLNPADFP